MKEKLREYIENNLNIYNSILSKSKSLDSCMIEACSISNYIENEKQDNKFQKMLFNYIDEKGIKDSDVYNKVNIDRRLFSKIRSDEDYHPSKETVILLGLSLELSLEEIEKFLNSASYSLPKNNVYDLIIRFCFINKIYDVFDVNDLLSEYNCKLIGFAS